MDIRKILLAVLSLTVIANPSYIFADEITVSGNGDGSSNAVNVSSTQNTSASQDNSANVNNNVSQSANTGNNSADSNSGNTSIATGNANSSSNITNSGINQSVIDNTNCNCTNTTTIDVSGNGEGSTNLLGYSTGVNSNVSVNNIANINNNVNGKANTGYNSANGNNGNVSITTGNIYATDSIKNKDINDYAIKIGNSNGGDVSLSIKDNGENSNNVVVLAQANSAQIAVDNEANINNNSNWDLNSGHNTADSDNGNVSITTGDVIFATNIDNEGINIGIVDVECCKTSNTPPPGTTTPPGPSGSNNNNGSTSSGGGGSSSGSPVTATTILPITGSPSLLVLALVNTLMFFMGWYLRLRSGRSPNFAR
jgi:hypothetical protein